MTSKSEQAVSQTVGHAIAAAGTSFGLKFFFPIPAIDAAPLTLITQRLCNKIAAIYGYKSLRGLSTFTGIVIGAASGAKLATEVTSLIPVAGATAGAIATFTLHMVTGVMLIIAFEALKQGSIKEEDLINSPVAAISELAEIALHKVADILRGTSGWNQWNDAANKFLDALEEEDLD